jgi:hypothetical protein
LFFHYLDDTGGKFATTPAVLVAKFATVVVNGAPSLLNISQNFRKKFFMALMLFSEAWGKMIQEKTF